MKKLKNVMCFVMAMMIVFSLAACSGNAAAPTEPTATENTLPTTEDVIEATEPEVTEETEAPTETPAESEVTEAPEVEATEAPSKPGNDTESPETEPPAATPEDTETDKATYKTVNETVYAKSAVYVRSGPGTNYSRSGSLKSGEAVKRVGIGSNGWSKIVFNGKEAYVSSSYLTTDKPAAETEPPVNTPPATEPPATEAPETEAPSTQHPAKEPDATESAHKHSYKAANTVAPTCTKDGYTTYKCSCGDSYTDDEKSATGHSWGNWSTTKEPTTSAEGEETRKCNSCGTSETQSISKLPSKETIDCGALESYGMSYASSLGFGLNYGLNAGNAAYFPPVSGSIDSMAHGRSRLENSIYGLYQSLMNADGSITGCQVNVSVTSDGNGDYTIAVYYGG